MTEPQAPTRWLEDLENPPPADLMLGLEAFRELGPTAQQQASMQAQLSRNLERAAATKLAHAATLKLLAKSLTVVAIVIAGMVWWSSRSSHAQRDLPPQAVRIVSPPAAIVAEAPAPIAKVVAAEAAPEPSIPKPRKATRATLRAEAPPAQQDAQAELALLSRARRLLASAPERTLDLTEEHARTYLHGIFEQEREVLTIEALVQAGLRSEASARASRFRKQYPSSAHLERIQVVLSTP